MKRLQTIIFCLLGLFWAGEGFGQSQNISSAEFAKILAAAEAKAASVPLRLRRTQERSKGGELSRSSQLLSESLQPDKRHILLTTKIGATEVTCEQIVVGREAFLRRSGGDWSPTDEKCDTGGFSWGSGIPLSQTQTFNKTQFGQTVIQHYRQYTLHGADGKSFTETEYFLDKNGLLERFQKKQGSLTPGGVENRWVDIYEYDPQLVIESPIASK